MSKIDVDLSTRTRSQWEQLIYEHIFSEKERMILSRRLLDAITYERLAEEFDMSDRQIKRIVNKSVSQLIKYI